MKTKADLLLELAELEQCLTRFDQLFLLSELPDTEWRDTVAFSLGVLVRLILDLQQRVEALEK